MLLPETSHFRATSTCTFCEFGYVRATLSEVIKRQLISRHSPAGAIVIGLLFLCAVFKCHSASKSVSVGADVPTADPMPPSTGHLLANSHNKGILFPSPHRGAVSSILHRCVNTSLHLSCQFIQAIDVSSAATSFLSRRRNFRPNILSDHHTLKTAFNRAQPKLTYNCPSPLWNITIPPIHSSIRSYVS